MLMTAPIVEQRIILQNITWQMFESLLAAKGETASPRYAYDSGALEIMSPLMPHEHTKRLLEDCVKILVDELNLNVKSIGSMTCKREDLERGLEPDSGFYLQNEPLVRSREQLDLSQDPPPDLILEIDFSSSSLNKLPIYQALAVPEVWRYAGGKLTVWSLQQGQYLPLDHSPSFGNLPLSRLPEFLQQSNQMGEAQMLRAFRAWVREQA